MQLFELRGQLNESNNLSLIMKCCCISMYSRFVVSQLVLLTHLPPLMRPLEAVSNQLSQIKAVFPFFFFF